MIYAKQRVGVICQQLKKYSIAEAYPISRWQMKKGHFIRPQQVQNDPLPWQEFNSLTDHWNGPDKHYWFQTRYTVPAELDGQPIWLIVHTQIDEWDDGKNPQFLLFLNGEPIQGLDMNHREVELSACARTGQEYDLQLQAYTGTLHSEFRLIGEIAQVDKQVLGLYYDLQVPLWALDRMDEDTQNRLQLEQVLNDTINLLDFRKVPSQQFSNSVRAARCYIQKELYENKRLSGFDDVVATCIGHTHIDVAWWWTVEQTREKVGRSFATVLKLMDEYPDYQFMSSQPQLYVFLKERYPELYARIKQRVKQNRWEVEGGMWVEADCNLTSGESLVRQFLYGKRFFQQEFGVDNRVLWLPDVFGYAGALPQIMKQCGIDYFMTTKLAWNQFNKIPNDTFLWRGIDGTEILTHLITTLGVGQSDTNFFTTYNGNLHPDAIMGGWKRYQNKEINHDILISFGYGDGGGGPTRAMLETAQRMKKGIKGVPKVRQAFARSYFEQLEKRVSGHKQLHRWEGELYFEYHRGTYTSMARNKRGNRKSELLLMDVEFLSVLAECSNMKYPAETLDQLWKLVLLNQFHDILPGTSIKEVYDQTRTEYNWIHQTAQALLDPRIEQIARAGDSVVVFNTLGFERNDVVNVGDIQTAALKDAQGKTYPVQQTTDGSMVYLTGLPSKGYVSFQPCDTESDTPFVISPSMIETPFYLVRFDQNGMFCSLFDKENNREVLQAGKCANLMRVYEDKPIYYDNWDIDIFYTEKYWDIDNLVWMEWIEQGSVRAVLAIERKFSSSVIRQHIIFYANMRRIDFETCVDWQEDQHLLKVHFPVDVHTSEATFDIQFGNVSRNTHRNTSWDVARFESCGQKWADVSEGGYGVSILNDCKYGYSVHDSNIALTLIKSGMEPYPKADREQHIFTYAMYPHAGSWREANTAWQAAKLNQPAIARNGDDTPLFSLISINSKNVMLETIKRSEDSSGIVVRVYEYQNCRSLVKMTLGKPIKSASECDLLENRIADVSHAPYHVDFMIKPYEIKTFLLVLD